MLKINGIKTSKVKDISIGDCFMFGSEYYQRCGCDQTPTISVEIQDNMYIVYNFTKHKFTVLRGDDDVYPVRLVLNHEVTKGES